MLAQIRYAEMAYKGAGGARDLAEARIFYKMAADQRDPQAMYRYAEMAYEGEGGPADFAEARKYFRDAADYLGEEEQFRYAQMAYKGEGGPQNLEEAKKNYKKAADRGHAEARFHYANMLAEENKIHEAVNYYELAYEQGLKDAYDKLLQYEPDYEKRRLKEIEFKTYLFLIKNRGE